MNNQKLSLEQVRSSLLGELEQQTQEVVDRELADLQGAVLLSKIDIFRHCYDEWMLTLKPVCMRKGKRFYGAIAEVLAKCGYGEVSENQIGRLLSEVRKERAGKSRGGHHE
ncbi:hypothetical protein [Paraburkholderia fungorum]|jgi:hypothetical protein|uniref:hypothetical protein n=1 Tax=Paraburkholderia fungorum TaxID=134537 RepID=UPI000D05554D|nr:hypothetical protein [Paraburkholderia fungorum]PRZ45414.1 hypothetical protein BX589_13993 [Paraburkholderia fungorum]